VRVAPDALSIGKDVVGELNLKFASKGVKRLFDLVTIHARSLS